MRRRWRWLLSGMVSALLLALLVAALEPFVARLTAPFPEVPTPPPSATPRPTSTFPPTRTPRPLATATPTATPQPWGRVPARYSLQVTFDYLLQMVEVLERITYQNSTGRNLDTLVLVLDPARIPGVVLLRRVQVNGTSVPVRLDAHRLEITLPEPLPPMGRVDLTVSYALALPRLTAARAPDRPVTLGYTSRQTNLTDWYAYIPPYHPEQGWLVHAPWYFGEHLVYPQADYQVQLVLRNVPQPFTVVTNATPVDCPPGTGADVQCFTMQASRGVVFSLSPYYRRVQTQGPEGIQVEGYVFLAEEAYGRDVVQAMREALETYSALFGPYHRRRLTLVQADFPDGMEFDGLFFVSQQFFNFYTQQRDSMLVTIAVHETAHQWWFAQVGNDQALAPWLDEALATYAEALYYEHQFPQGLDWWWTYRVDYYRPRGRIDGSIYEYAGWRNYRDAVYLNGAHFLQDLREAVGDGAFFTFLQAYRRAKADDIATPADFFRVLDQVTPAHWREAAGPYFSALP